MTTRLYVAGPMTGYADWNFPAFERAAEDLRDEGYEVVSPHEIDLEGGFDPSGDGAGFDLRAALERDVEAVLEADGVALLDGWEQSPGAVIEVLTASSKGAPARPVREWLLGVVTMVAALAALAGGVFLGSPDGGPLEFVSPDESFLAGTGEVLVEEIADALEDDGVDLLSRDARYRMRRASA